MDELIDRYVDYLRYERNASPHTIRNYHSDLVQFRDYLKEGNPDAVWMRGRSTPYAFAAFWAYLFESEKKKSSIGRKLAAVRAFYKFLAKEGVLTANPAATVSTPKLDQDASPHHDGRGDEQFPQLRGGGRSQGRSLMRRDRAIMELLYASGLRVSELAGLDLRSVNFGDGMLLVRGKGRKERIVPFGSKAKQALNEYLPVREKISRKRGRPARRRCF